MAEENQTPDTPIEAKPLTEVEQRAVNEGWVPQEEWSGDPEQWRPAKEFLDRGELFKKIEEQKRELKHMRAAIDDLGKHHAEVKKIAYREALAALKAQKKEALETGDTDAVIEIDDKIAEAREAQKVAEAPKPVAPEPVVNEAFLQWEARNAWYKTDRVMKAAADAIAQEMLERGHRDPALILAEVDKQMRKELPHKFENPNRTKAGAVEGSTTKSASRKDSELQLSDAEKRIMNRIVSTGTMTKEQYLKEYKARLEG